MPTQLRKGASPQNTSASPPAGGAPGGGFAALEAAVRVAPLRVGAAGDPVLELQRLLGMSEGGQTGTFGPTTEATLRGWQAANKVQPTGVVGPTTLEALRRAGAPSAAAAPAAHAAPSPAAAAVGGGQVFAAGAEGPAVLEIQRRLGMSAGGQTGRLGPTTEAQIRAFQQANGLEVDGIVGPKTWAALQGRGGAPSASAPAAPSPATTAPSPTKPAPSTTPASGAATGSPAAAAGGAARAIADGQVFAEGASGPAVLEIQKKLGMSGAGLTGVYGPTTARQVAAFQASRGLPADGRVGAATWAALSGPATRAGGAAAPVIDQHAMPHDRAWAFCGVATMAMALRAEGKAADTSSRAGLDGLARGMYIPGAGTSGAGMAANMRDRGLKGASYTTTGGTSALNASLAAGKTVPLGVVRMSGKVVDLPKRSTRYPGLREGHTHDHTFGASGHWVLVTGMEGDAANPSAYLVNDPDTGAVLRLTPAELRRNAKADEGMWMVTY